MNIEAVALDPKLFDELVMTYAKAADGIGCERGSFLYEEISRGLTMVLIQLAGWRTMDSAPRDGEPFLAYIGEPPHGDMMTVFDDDPSKDAVNHCWHRIDGMAYHVDAPRYWAPLPPPPVTYELSQL